MFTQLLWVLMHSLSLLSTGRCAYILVYLVTLSLLQSHFLLL